MRPLNHLPDYDRRIPVNDGAHSFSSLCYPLNTQKRGLFQKKDKNVRFF